MVGSKVIKIYLCNILLLARIVVITSYIAAGMQPPTSSKCRCNKANQTTVPATNAAINQRQTYHGRHRTGNALKVHHEIQNKLNAANAAYFYIDKEAPLFCTTTRVKETDPTNSTIVREVEKEQCQPNRNYIFSSRLAPYTPMDRSKPKTFVCYKTWHNATHPNNGTIIILREHEYCYPSIEITAMLRNAAYDLYSYAGCFAVFITILLDFN